MTYNPPLYLKNGHLQSIYPSLFRSLPVPDFKRERIITPDNDFLDLDWLQRKNKRLVIISHGLEGNSRRPYVIGMANSALNNAWDVLAWNYRGCSGEVNKTLASYHSGKTEDLALVIRHALSHGYDEVALIGFSIGGNKTLLHLGREYQAIPEQVIAAAALSVPCDLASSSAILSQPSRRLYMENFLKSFKKKLSDKQLIYPIEISLDSFNKIKNFQQFDARYTAPLNGFKSAEDYWKQSSCLYHLQSISKPSLILNALDDPFLSEKCFPIEKAKQNPNLTLEMPKYGGHVGFMPEKKGKPYYSEERVIKFLNSKSKILQ